MDAINQKWLDGWVAKNWKLNTKNPVKNIDLWTKYIDVSKNHTIEYVWVKGHNENKYNEMCDRLAVAARSAVELKEDTGFLP